MNSHAASLYAAGADVWMLWSAEGIVRISDPGMALCRQRFHLLERDRRNVEIEVGGKLTPQLRTESEEIGTLQIRQSPERPSLSANPIEEMRGARVIISAAECLPRRIEPLFAKDPERSTPLGCQLQQAQHRRFGGDKR